MYRQKIKGLLDLGERCSFNEQCSTRYAQCLGNQCQCISGTLRRHQQCVTVQQCPLGDAPLENGYPLICDRNTLKCPEGNYCLFAQFTDSRGFCCPTMKVNCPVGSPLSYGCASCPWETHHCFTYSIGTHQQSMCCPNDCPRAMPIRHGDKCYAIVGHLNHCSVDEQCLSVQNSVCLSITTNETTKICQCPINHILIDGICQKVSKLGGECEKDSDCFIGSNTVCRNGYCKCGEGFMPESIPLNWKNEKKTAFSIEHCIAEPTCPSIHGLITIEHYEDCSTKSGCSEGKFCHQWFEDPLKERNYSLCCPIPNVRDYEEICGKFGMKMLLTNELDIQQPQQNAQPFRCMLPTFHRGIESGATATAKFIFENSSTICPLDSACIFNPFGIQEGICCRYEQKRRIGPHRKSAAKATIEKSQIFFPSSSSSSSVSASTSSVSASLKESFSGKINGLFRFPFKKF
uniref:EB domain-containing protein n=1 Tax=Panagrolaimus superbus TaxID=310955 RepID=A0A914Y2C8_9BILA